GLASAQVIVKPRHDLDEIAGPVAVVELMHQDLVPGVAAGTGRAWQAEHIGAAGNARSGAGLDGRGADLGLTHQQEHRRKTVHTLLEQRLDRLRRHVPSGEAGAAGGDDHVDCRIRYPLFDLRADAADLIGDYGAASDRMARLVDTLNQRRAGFVVFQRARVRDREHRDLERYELPAVINSRHVVSERSLAAVARMSAAKCGRVSRVTPDSLRSPG